MALYGIVILAALGLWFISNRSKKQQRAQMEFRNNLVPGDEVMTHSGLLGTVVDVEDDVITLESVPGSQSRWIRVAISKKIEPPVDEVQDEDADIDLDDVDDAPIDVPDDLSSLPPARTDGDADKK